MFGAFLCKPVNPEADFGVMFMDTGGYLNMCGHCTIGAVTVAIEAGLVESKEGVNQVVLEAPAGLIRTEAAVSYTHLYLFSQLKSPPIFNNYFHDLITILRILFRYIVISFFKKGQMTIHLPLI